MSSTVDDDMILAAWRAVHPTGAEPTTQQARALGKIIAAAVSLDRTRRTAAANAARRNETMRACILTDRPPTSNRQIAKMCGCNEKTVRRIRLPQESQNR